MSVPELLRCSCSLSNDEIVARDAHLGELVQSRFASRLFARDETLFGPLAAEDVRTRLNWISAPSESSTVLAEVVRLRTTLPDATKLPVLLCGMGGSSLGPQMLTRSRGGSLEVLDTTYPRDVAAALELVQEYVIVVSSKSGTTVETRSQLSAIEHRLRALNIRPEDRIVVITDPNTELAQHAEKMGYTTVIADPHVGGRFSALTAYGLIPAALTGVDVEQSLTEAVSVQSTLSADDAANPALELAAAAVVRSRALSVRDQSDESGFAAWLEQLIAESTGKDAKGVLPVPVTLSHQRGNVSPDAIKLQGPLGAKIMAWEVATAAMCWLLRVNPFDQPDVERSKQATRELLSSLPDASSSVEELGFVSAADALNAVSSAVSPEDYVAIQYFGSSADRGALEELRVMLDRALSVPVTAGLGPAYLHSTGQLHKGGPTHGVFLQIIENCEEDVLIPGERFSFGELCRAQASGDAKVLQGLGKPVARTTASLRELIEAAATLL